MCLQLYFTCKILVIISSVIQNFVISLKLVFNVNKRLTQTFLAIFILVYFVFGHYLIISLKLFSL